jgi:polyhydroxybutyrate depolymerase
MRTAPRLCQLLAIFAATFLAACTGSDAGSGGGTGGKGTGGGAPGSGGSASGSGGSESGGSGGTIAGTGGNVAPGSGGASGTGGSTPPSEGGVTDAGDAGGGGKAPPMPSAGCGMPASQNLASYIRHNITVKGTGRIYDLYLPTGYDPARAYPLIFTAHGCDGSIPFHIENVTKTNAVIVAPRSLSSQRSGQTYGGGCFDTGPGSSSLTEVDYFDVMIADVEAKTCVDKARVFMQGHSSGSWLSHLLGCARGGVGTGPSGGLRGQGNTAGGTPVIPPCTGPIAAILAHDMQDDQNAFPLGVAARDRILKTNGCSMTETKPWDYDDNPATPSPCVAYQGCMPGFPVVWCPTSGKGHSDQVGPPFAGLSTIGFWKFWSQF